MEGWMIQMRWTDRIDRWAGGKMNEQKEGGEERERRGKGRRVSR